MSILDDPALALIARFVVSDIDNISLSEEAFLKKQFNEVSQLVKNVPKEQQQELVLEWICAYAEQYREQWRKGAVSNLLKNKRCPDCPLIHDGPDPVCIIHRSWGKLLNKYVNDRISSQTYINDALQLLNTHKNSLKVSLLSTRK